MNPTQQNPYAGIMQKYNYTPASPTGAPTTSADDWNSFVGKSGNYAAPAQEEPRLGEGALGEFGKGVVKSVAEMGGNIEKGVASVVGAIPGVHVSPEATKTIADEGISGAGETTGYIAGTLAPYFIPGGAGTLPVKAAPLLAKLAETLGVKAESFIPKATAYIVKNLPEFGKNVAIGTAQSGDLTTGLEVGAGGEALKGLGIGAKMIKNYGFPTPTVNQIIGQVAQGSSKDIPSFGRGLTNLDTSGVKTYDDLYKLSSGEIKKLAAQQDALLAQDKTLYKVQQLATSVKAGGSEMKHNYVLDSIKQLKAFYAKTNNVAGLRKMEVYESRLNPKNGEGLLVKEVNDIARLHGSDLNAYNANGELASGLTKQAAENTRKGLKSTVRGIIKDEESKTLDSQMSDIYTVRDLSEKMTEKVNTLKQRLQTPSILQKLGGVIGRGLRFTGIGDLASSLLGIEKVPGARTLNPVELEARLAKNLKRIDAALQKDDAGLVKEIKAMVQESDTQAATQPIKESVSTQTTKANIDNTMNPNRGFVNLTADMKGKSPNAEMARQLETEELITKPYKEGLIVKPGSVQEMSEKALGFQEGMKKIFDDALQAKDRATIYQMIKDGSVPKAYQETFSKEIKEILAKKP